ncbi:hypothetical protein [Sinorhizobium americanum]|uniref:hypothetical protein n=1 Tax=Sinorhizobium americanum TaxID=194963 RepID=UPI0013A581F1|nr:hypothetical protein [Sinorhizobium americanum]
MKNSKRRCQQDPLDLQADARELLEVHITVGGNGCWLQRKNPFARVTVTDGVAHAPEQLRYVTANCGKLDSLIELEFRDHGPDAISRFDQTEGRQLAYGSDPNSLPGPSR